MCPSRSQYTMYNAVPLTTYLCLILCNGRLTVRHNHTPRVLSIGLSDRRVNHTVFWIWHTGYKRDILFLNMSRKYCRRARILRNYNRSACIAVEPSHKPAGTALSVCGAVARKHISQRPLAQTAHRMASHGCRFIIYDHIAVLVQDFNGYFARLKGLWSVTDRNGKAVAGM